jgi:hypothetical protein
MVLPILGGAPMVWNGCVVFFQPDAAGYGYAFGASKWLRLRQHVVITGYGDAGVALPFMIADRWCRRRQPAQVAAPAAPAASASLLCNPRARRSSSTVAVADGSSGRSRSSRLYAASNFGCLPRSRVTRRGEPLFTLRERPVFGPACMRVPRAGRARGIRVAASRRLLLPELRTSICLAAEALTTWRRARWVALAFIPSS